MRMKRYNMACPFCGHMNKQMYLEETDGWMECEHCHKESKVMTFAMSRKLPMFTMDGILQHMQAGGGVI